MSYLV